MAFYPGPLQNALILSRQLSSISDKMYGMRIPI